MSIAREILNQLGGNMFLVMTGAKALVSGPDYLAFKLPSNFARDGINHVTVRLDPSDTYTVEFRKVRGLNVKEVRTDSMVYCDTLRETFTAATGLDCTMGRIRA